MSSENAPPNDETASDKLSKGQISNSVYDFLYHDARRVASFLSQFDTYGQLLSVKAIETEESSASDRSTSTLGGAAAVLKASKTSEHQSQDRSFDSAERTYDPLWKNARTFLNYLEERNMLNRSIWDAQIGQFVLVTGGLAVLDLAMFKDMYDGPLGESIKTGKSLDQLPQASKANRSDRRRNAKTDHSTSSLETDNPFGAVVHQLMKALPHTVQIRLVGGDFSVWTMPDPEFLITSVAGLLLKHGPIISGQWTMIGVLDAQPDGPDRKVSDAHQEIPEDLAEWLGGTIVGKLAVQVGPIARHLLGRPPAAHGVTPLLIFRDVSG